MKTVDLGNGLKKWIMHPKGNVQDTVVLGALINQDSMEILSGPQSTITQRDWIVFTTKYVSPNIQPLKPRYSSVNAGDLVWYAGCPYDNATCVVQKTKVIEAKGNRIVFERPLGANVNGASGSPIIDKDGFLIGILGGSSINRNNGASAMYGISTRYLRKVLSNEKPLNVPLIPISDVFKTEVTTNGLRAGLKRYYEIREDDSGYFEYDFTPEKLNALGEFWMQRDKTDWAVAVLKLSLEELPMTNTYLKLASAYRLNGNNQKAKETYLSALRFWPENQDIKLALEQLRD